MQQFYEYTEKIGQDNRPVGFVPPKIALNMNVFPMGTYPPGYVPRVLNIYIDMEYDTEVSHLVLTGENLVAVDQAPIIGPLK
jgi:hypothetical protein